ncbi:uncharacterized protein LOC110815504 isoform X2 [Carica papaya]|uniref:uncharacterized protein LOC110815504 isoform X2 n=1 Tax=Carica papaya TaxID=3649 RepID=UPI000B8CD324|nr:uncharacterized protein LOC110815504 isoform X2 [Carica papaya]
MPRTDGSRSLSRHVFPSSIVFADKFCYNCIVHWTEVSARKHSCSPSFVKCPLCKKENFSIIHGFDGSSFERHYVNQTFGNGFLLSRAHKYRLQCYYTEPGILNDIFDVPWYWKSRKYVQANQWLLNWLRREIQALVLDEDVEIIAHHILDTIDSFRRRNEQKHKTGTPETKQEEFKLLVSDAARRFLMARTDRFVHELELFLASGFNLEAYDAVYMQRLGWNTPRGTTVVAEEEHNQSVIPYLYIFDDESDEAD